MNSIEASIRLKEIIIDNKMQCTEDELQDFLLCGLLMEINGQYLTRNRDKITIDVINNKNSVFNINLSNLISISQKLAKQNNIQRVFCMSSTLYNKYKDKGLIITKNNIAYYKVLEDELWLVNLIK